MSTAEHAHGGYQRLHHFGFPTRDAIATRSFYEDVLELPLVACWTEVMEEDGARFWGMHMYFQLSDGAVLGFTAFDRPFDQARYCQPVNQFVHVAIKVDRDQQEKIVRRLAQHEHAVETFFHGYCRSAYVRDPNGLVIEFTQDTDVKDDAFRRQRSQARSDFDGWVAGRREDNNPWREKIEIAHHA